MKKLTSQDMLEREREAMVVTQYQARKALKDQELLSQVEDMMADPDTDEDVKLMWQFKDRIRRLHSVTNQMLDSITMDDGTVGMTEEQKDDLFRYGMSVEK